MAKLSDEEFNLISTLTMRTHLDGVFDIASDNNEDFFWDMEEDRKMSLEEGFELLSESIAYSFQHEGFSDEESKILEEVIQKYVPGFEAIEPHEYE